MPTFIAKTPGYVIDIYDVFKDIFGERGEIEAIVSAVVVSPDKACFSNLFNTVDPVLFVFLGDLGFWRVASWDLKDDIEFLDKAVS